MKKWLLIIISLLLLFSFSFFLYLYLNPLRFIDRLVRPLKIVRQSTAILNWNNETRQYLQITFQRNKADTFCVTISRPVKATPPRLPVIVLLGGLEIGRHSLNYIPKHGQNIIVAYEYPYRPKYWYEGTPLQQIPLIRQSVLVVPGQVSQLVDWLHQQSWADTNRISLLGYSFGALAVPSVLRIMQLHQIKIDGAIMAYGGANLCKILKANLKTIPSYFRPIVAGLASLAIRPVEPALHLPHLKGKFLLINGQFDHQIPAPCWRTLHQLTPQSKKIILLKEGHLHPRKKALIQKVITLSYKWLAQNKLIHELKLE